MNAFWEKKIFVAFRNMKMGSNNNNNNNNNKFFI